MRKNNRDIYGTCALLSCRKNFTNIFTAVIGGKIELAVG